RVTVTRRGYQDISAASTNTAVVAPTNFSHTPQVSITGNAVVDDVLSADVTGAAAAVATTSFQWLADGAPINGETARTLTLTPALLDATIGVEVAFAARGFVTDRRTTSLAEPVAQAQFG